MNILLTGATGFIGSHLLKQLLVTKHSVKACVHHSIPPLPCQTYQVDFMQMQDVSDWLPLLEDIDVVINCVGIITESSNATFDVMHHRTPVALFKACEQTTVKKLIQISALGADETALVSYHKTKKLADDYLQQSNLHWFILKPSLVYGEAGDSFQFFKKLSNLPLIPLIGDGQQLIQPVHIKVVILTVLRCLDNELGTSRILNLVGPQAMTYQHWMQSIRSKKSTARFIRLPFKMMMLFAKLGRMFGLRFLAPDNLIMLKQNNCADPRPLQNFLEGKSP